MGNARIEGIKAKNKKHETRASPTAKLILYLAEMKFVLKLREIKMKKSTLFKKKKIVPDLHFISQRKSPTLGRSATADHY